MVINFFFRANQYCYVNFLYGPNWNVKMKKDEEYLIKVINNKPDLFKIKKIILD
jgi:hypothetical protein